jgi:hypothetical protein
LRKRDINRQRRVMYRGERLDVHFNVKLPRVLREELHAAAAAEGVRHGHLVRTLIALGLDAWRWQAGTLRFPTQLRLTRGRIGRWCSERGVLFDLQMSREMRAALSTGAAAEGLRVSDFARWVIDLGLAAWRAQRAPKIRFAGAR